MYLSQTAALHNLISVNADDRNEKLLGFYIDFSTKDWHGTYQKPHGVGRSGRSSFPFFERKLNEREPIEEEKRCGAGRNIIA